MLIAAWPTDCIPLPRERACGECGEQVHDGVVLMVRDRGLPIARQLVFYHAGCAVRVAGQILSDALRADDARLGAEIAIEEAQRRAGLGNA